METIATLGKSGTYPANLQRFVFDKDELELFLYEDLFWLPIFPICEVLGINYESLRDELYLGHYSVFVLKRDIEEDDHNTDPDLVMLELFSIQNWLSEFIQGEPVGAIGDKRRHYARNLFGFVRDMHATHEFIEGSLRPAELFFGPNERTKIKFRRTYEM